MKYTGLNPIYVRGSKFELGYGYSNFIKLKINNKIFTPIISATANTHGLKDWKDRIKNKVFVGIEEKSKYLSFFADANEFELSGPFIAGYPSIRLGESVWGPTCGFKLGKLKNYSKMGIYSDWKFVIKKGYANLAYDIWLTKGESGPVKKNDIEIMVWLDYNFEVPHEIIKETDIFKLKYIKKRGGQFDGVNWITFIIKKGKSNNFKFDLLDLINYCKTKIKNIEDYYIRSIDLGVELSKNTKAEAKLYELNFDFTKRG